MERDRKGQKGTERDRKGPNGQSGQNKKNGQNGRIGAKTNVTHTLYSVPNCLPITLYNIQSKCELRERNGSSEVDTFVSSVSISL